MSECKNALSTYTTNNAAVAVNGALPLEQNSVLVGNAITHTPGSTTITLSCPGIYLVSFDAEGSTTAGTGSFTTALFNNGVAVPGAESTSGATSTTNVETIGFTSIIQVRPSCCAVNNVANLTFINTGAASTYTTINVNVVKI